MKLDRLMHIANLVRIGFHLSVILAFFGVVGQVVAILIGAGPTFLPIALVSILSALGFLLVSLFAVVILISNT